jgi:ABC-type transporter Mla subunit MlaD
VERAGKVADIIAEIAAASNEQAQGIEQVNTAMSQMNTVTQQNAANSEESASAAEELNSQAAELSNMVGTFNLSGQEAAKPQNRFRASAPKVQPRAAAIPGNRFGGRGGVPALVSRPATKMVKAITPEEVIPLDESDLVEF